MPNAFPSPSPSGAQTLTGGDTSSAHAQAAAEAALLMTDASDTFNTDVIQLMLSQGLDPSQIPPDQLTRIINQLWGDSYVQSEFQTNSMSPYLDNYLRDQLFSPSASSNPSTLYEGLSALAKQNLPLTASQSNYIDSFQRQVPTPFDPKYLGQTSLTFGQPFDGTTEDGIDYRMPPGTALYSPFAGTIVTEDMGKADWGKRVFVKLANGYIFAIGHMTSFAVTNGEQVEPGMLLGLSGGAQSDPSSGNSTGPHVEIQWISPNGTENVGPGMKGSFTNPASLMQQIYSGTTFSAMNMIGEAGNLSLSDQMTLAQQRLLGIDPALDTQYPSIVSAWETYFGTHPTGQQVLQVANAAGSDATAQTDYIRSLPSPDLPGASVGAVYDLQGQINTAMQGEYGHDGTFAMVKDFFDKGITGPAFVKQQILNLGVLGQIPADALATPGQAAASAQGAPTPTPQQAPQPSPGATPTPPPATPALTTPESQPLSPSRSTGNQMVGRPTPPPTPEPAPTQGVPISQRRSSGGQMVQ